MLTSEKPLCFFVQLGGYQTHTAIASMSGASSSASTSPVAVPLPLSEHGRLFEPAPGSAELDEPAVVHGVVDNRRRELVIGVDGAPPA